LLSDWKANFLGKVVGSFLQSAAVSMNWCEVNSMDSLWLSLQKQWQGVGTLNSNVHQRCRLIAALN